MEKHFQYNGKNICYKVIGNGKPVILLHGFAEDSSVWKHQVQALQQQCQLIIPDLPGSGKSELLLGENVTIDDYAACIKALIDNEKLERVTLLGHSMGGYITLAFAEKYPEALNAFGLIHSTAFADSDEKKATRKKGIEIINEYGAYPFIKNTTPNLFSSSYKQHFSQKVDELIEQGKAFTNEALIQYYNAMITRRDRTNVLSESNVPVLFIIGSEDVAAPKADLLKQVHLPKVSHIHILENVGHMGMWEAAETVNKHILQFIPD